ncbi:ALMS1 protein, partial [Polypterus senegalus]
MKNTWENVQILCLNLFLLSRPLPDNSYMTEEFPGPLQLNPALQLATTDVFPDSVSSGPLSQCPLMMSTFDPDDEKNINIILPQHQLSHRSVLEEQVERELREECELSLVGQEEFSNCSESQVHEEKGGQKSESNDQALHEELPRASMADDVSFLDSDIPVPLLLELLEKEVGVSSSGTCSAVSTSSSHAELPSRNLEKYETVPLDTDRVVSPNVINDTIANSVAQGFTFSSSELPANIIRDQPVVGNVVQSFDSSNGQKEKNELNVFNASDVSYVTAKQESAKSNENKVDVDSHDTYSGRASTVIEFPTDLSKGSLDCSVERGFKEGELSSSAHQTNVDSSVFGLPLKPISQSTPGMFLGAPKSTVQYNLSKGTTNQSKKECSLDKLSPIQSKQEMLVLSTSTSLDITPKALLNSSTGKELPEPTPETNSSSTGKCSNEQSLFVNKKFQSLPALNYMEKVGAWNMTFPTSKTEFDNLALRGFTGVSPRQKAYSAIADSLNQLLSRKNSTKSFSPSTSDNSKSPKKSLSSSFCGNLSPATDFLENKGSLTNSPLARSWSCTSIKEEQLALDQKQDDVLCQNIEGAEKITKCLPDNIVLTRVLNSCRKEDSQEKVAEKMASDKDHGNLVKNNILSSDSASCNLDILLQPVEHEHHHCEGGPPNRFSDESPNETVGTLVSFQDANYKDVNSLHASYDVSAVSPPNNLQTDSYASHCATNPSTPVKNVEFNIEERIPHYLRALGIDQSPSTILTPFAPRGPIREPEFSPTDLCTIKGSTCTQQSEGDSPLKGDFSQSSILSINSTLSLSVPLGSDADSETPLPSEPAITNDFRTSVERPVSQCSPHVDFHPIDHSLDIPLQKSCSSGSESSKLNSEESLARFTQKQSPSVIGRLVSENFQNNINNFDSGHPSAPDNLPSISLLASDHQTEVMNSPTLNLSSGSLLTKESHAEMNNSILNSSESSSGRIASETSFQNLNIDNDSFEGAKTLKEIRKLLSKTEEPPFPRSSFSSPSASLRGSEDISAYLYKGLDNFNFQGSLASHFDVNDNGSYWHKSSSSSTLSLLTLDGLKESLIFDGCFSTRSSSPSSFISQGKKSIQSKRQEKIDSLTESKQVGHEYGQGGSFIADSVKRFEPEGCSEARQINASFASTMSFAAPSLELDDVQENPEDIAQETPETIFLPSTVTEMIGIDESHETVKVIEGSDRSSANSIASQVAFLLKTESPVTSASSIINAANEEEAKARGQQSIIPSKLMELHEDKETQVSMRSTQGMSSQRSIPASPWEQKGLISAGLKKSRVFENADLSRKSSEDANSIPSSHNIIQPFVRTTYKTVEVQTDEQQFAVDEPDFARIMDKNRRNAQKCEMAYSIGNLHDHLSSRRKSPTSTRADNSIRSQSTTSHMTHSGYYHDGYHAKHSQSLDRSLQSSKSLDQLWEKFKQRQHQEKSADTSTGEPTLLERLERLSRLLQHPTRHSELCKEEYSSIRDDGGKRPLSLQIQKEERRDLDKRKKQAWVKSFPDSKSIQTSPHAKHGMVFETDSDLGTLHETSSESMQFPQKYLTSDETAESSNSVITSETDTAAQTESNFSAPADTSSSVSTINTSRLIRAFGPEKVVVNPYLSKLYHTIDKQKENLEKRTQNRTSKASRKPLTSSATFSGNKMVSNPLPTVETSCKPSHHQKNKKPTVLVHKSIQAGHFEIVSNATKKNTKDVGMTFPSPDSDSGPHTRFSAEARNEEASHNRLLFERSEHPRVFLYEKKRKNRQRHPRGTHFLYHSSRTPINMSIKVITIDQRTVTYRVVSMPGDGNYLFHSVCYILHGHIRLTLDIRRNIVSYVLNDWDWFKVWTDDGTVDNYSTQEH